MRSAQKEKFGVKVNGSILVTESACLVCSERTNDMILSTLTPSDNTNKYRSCIHNTSWKMAMMRLRSALVLMATTTSLSCTAFVPAKDAFWHTPKLAMAMQQQVPTVTEPSVREENPRLSGLSLMLDDGTRKSHSMAENTAFVSGFFKGVSTTREAYRNLVTSLYFVYEAMEVSMDTTNEKCVQILDDPALRRLPSLKQDMDFYYGSAWQDMLRLSPATQTYVARIKEVAEKQPYLLIGHQYSRYLGDLFGGQMMGSMATRSLDLKNGNGVAFYRFDDITNTKDYITEWYTRLNNLDLTDEQKQEIADEANAVFALNIGIFDELEGSSLQAVWTMGVNTLKLRLGIA